ncbi:MAG: efflux RND transporter permease subunit [Clostridia bacterium]
MLTKFCIKKPWSVIVVMIIVMLLGIISYVNTSVDLLPNINLPYVVVASVQVGAAPETVEKEVTKPTEEALSTISGIKNVNSMSMENLSMVVLEFESNVKIDNVVIDIREKINMMSGVGDVMDSSSMATEGIGSEGGMSMPKITPMIFKMNPSMMPMMLLSMGKTGIGAKDATAEFKEIIRKIESVEGVASVSTQGLVSDIVLMQLSPDNLLSSVFPSLAVFTAGLPSGSTDMLNGLTSILTPSLLKLMLTAQNIEMPAGSVSEDGLSYFVKVGSDKIEDVEKLKKVPMLSINLKQLIGSIKNAPEFAEDKISLELIGSSIAKLTGGANENDITTNLINQIATMALPDEIKSMIDVSDLDKVSSSGKYIKRDGKYIQYDLDKVSHQGETRYNAPTIKLGSIKVGSSQVSIKDVIFGDKGIIEKDLAPNDYSVMLTLGSITKTIELDTSGSVLTTLNGQPTVTLNIMKQPNFSAAEISKDINKILEAEKKSDSGFFFVPLMDQGFFINEAISSALSNMLTGGLLAILILFMFLKRIKPTIVVGVSIAISVVFSFVLMYFAGVTLNIVSMGGLALGVGMLVDNSIIVIENIYRHRKMGKDAKTAALDGTKQILGAIISSTITTVIIFVPIFFVNGMVKEIFKDMALTITFSLLASLLFSITLVPMAATTFLKNDNEGQQKVFDKVRNFYKKCIIFALDKRWIVVATVVVLLAGSIVGGAFMGKEMFPSESSGTISATAEIDIDKIPEGATLDEVMLETIDKFNARLLPLDFVQHVSISQSTSMMSSMTGTGDTGSNKLSINVIMKKKTKVSDKDAANKIKEVCQSENGLYKLQVSGQTDSSNMGALMGDAVSVYIYCEDLDDLKDITIKATDAIRGIKGVKEVKNGLEKLPLEYKLIVDKEKASKYGLTTAQVLLQVNSVLANKEKTTNIKFKGDTESTTVKFYPADYTVLEWIKTSDSDGKYIKVYKDGKNHYIVNNTNADILYKASNVIKTAKPGDSIPVVGAQIGEGKAVNFSYTLADGTDVNFNTDAIPKYFYSAKPKAELDLIMCKISNSMDSLGGGMDLSGLVGTDGVELWKILDESCFIKDENGKVMLKDLGNGNVVPYGLQKTEGYFTINHLNGKRYLAITGAVNEGFEIDKLNKEIKSVFNNIDFNGNYATYEFQGQMMLITETFNSVYLILGLGIVLIYLVMVAQFQSLKSPLIVMFTIPLALSGCIYSLLITNMNLSASALIGVVILVGVIVNNGIVFVDYANKLIEEEGLSVRDALVQTGYDRLRPILMTALTTVFGMATMALDTTAAGSMIRPMAVAAMGGLTYASLLTLFVVPVMYSFFHKNLDDKRIVKNPPKAYPSDFDLNDILAYENAACASGKNEGQDGQIIAEEV